MQFYVIFAFSHVGCFEVTEKEDVDITQDSLKTRWFESKDGNMRHVVLAKDKSDAGRAINDKTFQLIRNWIRLVLALPLPSFVYFYRSLTNKRSDTIVDLFCAKAKEVLKQYLKEVHEVKMKVHV